MQFIVDGLAKSLLMTPGKNIVSSLVWLLIHKPRPVALLRLLAQ